MGKYAQLTDCTDPAVRVAESHLAAADTLVDADLWGKGVNPASMTLPHPLLTQLAVAYALEQAAREQARGADTTLMEKATGYTNHARSIKAKITLAALGLLPAGLGVATGGALGSIPIGRG